MKKAGILKALLPLLLLALCCTATWAAEKAALKLVSKAEKEVTVVKDGKKEVKRTLAEKALPGDVIIFTNHYTNTLEKPVDDAVITNPVPKNVTYIDGSAFGDGAVLTFSVDKGKTFDTPGKLVKTEKGKKRPARAEEYSHIRWTFDKPIQPGKQGEVGYKARIK